MGFIWRTSVLLTAYLWVAGSYPFLSGFTDDWTFSGRGLGWRLAFLGIVLSDFAILGALIWVVERDLEVE